MGVTAPSRPRVLLVGTRNGIAPALQQRLPGVDVVERSQPPEPGDPFAAVVVWSDHVRSDAVAREWVHIAGDGDVLLVAPVTVDARPLVDAGVRRVLFEPLDVDELAAEVAAATARSGSPSVVTTRKSAADVTSGVSAIWERFRPRVLSAVTNLETAAMAVIRGDLTPEDRRAAEREAHRLAGSLGTFGFPQGSQTARELEMLLQGGEPLGPGDALRASELVVSLRDLLEEPTSEAPAHAADDRDHQPVVCLVGIDGEEAAAVATGVQTRAVTINRMPRPLPPPYLPEADVVVVDVSLDRNAGFALVEACAARNPATPVIVLDDDTGLTDRVEVARRGGRGFLQKPVQPAEIAAAVQQALDSLAAHRTTVLCVDDDEAVLAALADTLRANGLHPVTLADPLQFWDVLQSTAPDLVILDVDMPATTGVELCRVLRNDQRWAVVPVVFLTGRTDAQTVGRLFAAGADDYVAKPLVGPELMTRVTNRLERVRLLRDVVQRDSLTGLLQRAAATEAMHTALATAQRRNEPYAIGLVDLSGLAALNAEEGYAAGDRLVTDVALLLQRHFRGVDVIGRWPGGVFGVGMYGMSASDAAHRCGEFLETVRERLTDGLTVSIGVASAPEDGSNAHDVLRAASAALANAAAAGGDRVGQPAAARASTAAVDVVVVEDDEALAALLVHALQTRGYRVAALTDGEQAAQALTESQALTADVVLLDVDLPSLDGLGVLRAMSRAGVLRSTKVVMLTARAAELEVLKAMELGAFDHVAKPFSIPVLMQRIRRAVDV